MADAMTVEGLHAKLAEYIAAGHGNARVFASIRGDHDLDAAMQASGANWTPGEFELTRAEDTGRDAPMLVIGHVAFDYPEDGGARCAECTHLVEQHDEEGCTVCGQCSQRRAAEA